MSSTLNIGLAGIAGYGDLYLESLLPQLESLDARLVGAVDPMPQRCRRLDELLAARVPIVPTVEQLFSSIEEPIDLMLIVTPIHLHAPQTIFSLRHGASVLCEKPAAGTVADALRMRDAAAEERAGGKFAAVGFQWSFSDAVQQLKRDIARGVFGRPLRMKALAFFPRPIEYFRRNDWCGRLRAADGRGIYDSPVNNATSHFLHNMFYLLGRSPETSAMPRTVQAELYRANEIENYDTAAIRSVTECGCELLFYTTHATSDRIGPLSQFEFEHAVIDFAAAPIAGLNQPSDTTGSSEFVARFRDGRTKSYGSPNIDCGQKIRACAEAVRSGQTIPCGVDAALPHARCVAAAQRSPIAPFPSKFRRLGRSNGQEMVLIDALQETLIDCYRRGVLPSERGDVEWARPSAPVHVAKIEVLLPKRRPAAAKVASAAEVD